VYNLKQEKKDHLKKIKELEEEMETKDKELRRMRDIVYDVTTMNIKPNFGLGNRLNVPKYKNYEQHLLNEKKEKEL
jgi:hypothetical protein